MEARIQHIIRMVHWLLIAYCGILAVSLIVLAYRHWLSWRIALPAMIFLSLGAWVFRPKRLKP